MSPRRRNLSMSASITSESLRSILYTIISEGSDWIVSGKVQGLIDLSSGADVMSLQFRGIPTQSGILRNFPELFLEYLPTKGSDRNPSDSPPITVHCRNPDCFKSMAYTTSTSLAVPAGIDDFWCAVGSFWSYCYLVLNDTISLTSDFTTATFRSTLLESQMPSHA